MEINTQQRQLKKAVQIAFLGEFIWLLMMIAGWVIYGWYEILSDITRLTFQSNLFAFLAYGAYLKWPHAFIFKTNCVFIFIGSILFTAAVGFWLVIIPICFIDLREYLQSPAAGSNSSYFSAFQFVWNHTATPMLYIFAIKQIFRSCKKWHLYSTDLKTCMKYLFLFMLWLFLIHMSYSWWDKVDPAYGIFSNWNWNTKFTAGTGNKKLFNLNVVWFSNGFLIFVGVAITAYLYWLSIKSNPDSSKNKYSFKFISSDNENPTRQDIKSRH